MHARIGRRGCGNDVMLARNLSGLVDAGQWSGRPWWRRPLHGNAGRYVLLARQGARYLTPKKIANVLRCEMEKRQRSARVRSYPYVATLDVTNLCNLRCPYCPTGAQRDAGRNPRTMPLSVVDRLLEEVGGYLISANLFNWGEPFIHRDIADIVERIHARGIFTQLSSNLSIDRSAALEDVCRAGLDYLMISTSGASQAVNAQYHRRGRLSQVAENARAVVEFKRKNRRATPVVEWKYLVFKHNAHEVSEARALAARIGVDIFRAVRGGGEESALVKPNEAPPSSIPVRFCHQLWQTIVVNSDGGIAPCCYLYFKSDDFAELAQGTVMEARNSSRYLVARSLFDPSAVATLPPDLQHPCLKCQLVHRVPHLKQYLTSNPHAAQQARTGGP